MVTATSSTTVFQLDDGTGTFPYDISSKVLYGPGCTFNRGRDDWQSSVTAGQCSFTLDNSDGRFTPGSTIIASPSPIKVDQRVRMRVTIPSTAETNLLSAENASFEGGTVGSWVAAGTVLPSVANSAVRAYDGTKSLLITWAGSGANPQAQVQGSGFTIGQTYTFAPWVYVPAGGPDVRCGAGATVSALTSLKDQWVRLQVTFVAASTTPTFFIRSSGTPAASTCFVDAAMVVAGSTIGDFNTLTQATYTRFTDYLKSLPVSWPATVSSFATAAYAASDAQARAERRILRSYTEEEILADTAAEYFTLGEPAGAISAADSSGNQAPALTMAGSGTDVVFGTATGPGTDGLTAADFAGGKYLAAPAGSTPAIAGVVCAFSTAGDGILVGRNPGDALLLIAGGNVFGPTGATLISSTIVTDGKEHVAELRYTATDVNLYIDGNLEATSGTASVSIFVPQLTVGQNLTGTVAHVALFTTSVGAARPAAHAQAMLTGFAGESGTARLTRIAGYAGIPVGTLDTSLTNVAFKDIGGGETSAWTAIQDVANAEFGLAFIDGSGNLTFHNRNRVALKTTPDLTIAASFLTADPTATTDDADLINHLDVTAETTGVTQLVNDTSSIASHGTYPESASYLVQTDAEALDRGNWIVFTHKEPGPRYGTLVINLLGMPTTQLQAVYAAVEPNAWLRVTSMPSQNTGGTTADVIVQGFTEQRTDRSWTLTCNVADKATVYPTPWILGDLNFSVLGSTTRLGV